MNTPQAFVSLFGQMKTSLITAVKGLTRDQITSFEPDGHWPIAWHIEHMTGSLDFFVHKGSGAEMVSSYHDIYHQWPLEQPPADHPYPTLEEMLQRWEKVLDHAIDFLKDLAPDTFEQKSQIWDATYSESLLVVMQHHYQHLGMIWFLLGQKRNDEKWEDIL